jgi:hypothetical protein
MRPRMPGARRSHGCPHHIGDDHRMSLLDKFNIKSKTGPGLFAMRWGLLK